MCTVNEPGFLILFFQTLMNVKWMKAAVRVTAATPLGATTANVLKAAKWGQTARLVMVRWPARDLNATKPKEGMCQTRICRSSQILFTLSFWVNTTYSVWIFCRSFLLLNLFYKSIFGLLRNPWCYSCLFFALIVLSFASIFFGSQHLDFGLFPMWRLYVVCINVQSTA